MFGLGMNRLSQIYEQYMVGFDFAVLDKLFLIHCGFKIADDFDSKKRIELAENQKLYQGSFFRYLQTKYA